MSKLETQEIYKSVLKPIIDGLPNKDLRKAFLPLSCVRLLDSTMMQAVVSATVSQACASRLEWRNDILRGLNNAGVMEYKLGFSVEKSIRHLAMGYLKDHEPKIYKGAHTAALREYKDLLRRPVDSRGLFIQEELYHVASLNPQAHLPEVLEKRLKEYPGWIEDFDKRQQSIGRLRDGLETDNELRLITSCIPAMLGTIDKYSLRNTR